MRTFPWINTSWKCPELCVSIRIIGMVHNHINQPVAELLTRALITSRLDPCNSWPQQNAAKTTPAITKHCCQTCHALQEIYSHHTILKQLHWLPIEQRIIFKSLMFVFKTINSVSPTYLCSLVKPYKPLLGNMHSANQLPLTEHKSKNSWGARLFTVSTAKTWNTLPNNIRASATISVFKTALKTHRSFQSLLWVIYVDFSWTCSGRIDCIHFMTLIF